jgi:chemotaxis regulatin CheY-phosphate phosphatase CheZ
MSRGRKKGKGDVKEGINSFQAKQVLDLALIPDCPMTSLITRPPETELAYEQIEAAVKETNRGRWFLEEFARRNRNADTHAVIGAIEALQRALASQPHATPRALHASEASSETAEILDMARAIARAQAEIRALRVDGEQGRAYHTASDELDAVIATTEQATSSILSAAERVQEQAWTLRERALDPTLCDHLDACATEIYTACAFQDLTAQRIRKMVDALTFIDDRLTGMLKKAGLAAEFEAEKLALSTQVAAARPQHDVWLGEAHQAEIDETFDFFTPAAAAIEPTMIGAELLDLEQAPLSMDELLKAGDDKASPDLPRGIIQEAVPASTQAQPDMASPSRAPSGGRTFRFEVTGPGTPDHDELLDGIVDQAVAAALPPLDELDGKAIEYRLKAFR